MTLRVHFFMNGEKNNVPRVEHFEWVPPDLICFGRTPDGRVGAPLVFTGVEQVTAVEENE